MKKTGIVYLVGAGPGDPGLITKKGFKLLRTADTVVVDALVNPQLFQSLKADIIYAGKRGPGAPHGSSLSLPQEVINRLLVRLAKQGKTVVRLKGGDPFVFGRGSEELESLVRGNIPFEIVPGITSAIAAPAYAGIPVTDRRWASQVTFVTGHGQADVRGPDEMSPPIDWNKISKNGTLVVLMGVASWKNIQKKLLASGWSSTKPVAAVESGTNEDQRIITTTLGQSVKDFSTRQLVSPAVIIVGDVVPLAKKFGWSMKKKPLFDKKVVVTRPADQSGELASLLERRGATILLAPTIRIKPLKIPSINKEQRTDWLLFLSVNAVRTFGRPAGQLRNARVLCVGPQTKRVAEELGWRVAIVPRLHNTAGILNEMKNVKGKRVLIPRVQNAPKNLAASLKKKGALVQEVITYQTLSLKLLSSIKKKILAGVDAVTFTSASTVKGFCESFTPQQRRKIFQRSTPVSMGPQTTAALRAFGVKNIQEAKNSTLPDLVKAIS